MQVMNAYNNKQSIEYKRLKMEAKKRKAEIVAEDLKKKELNSKASSHDEHLLSTKNG